MSQPKAKRLAGTANLTQLSKQPELDKQRDKVFKELMTAYDRFESAGKELVLAKDNLNKKIEAFKQQMPQALDIHIKEF
jgi:hypothetical protein